MRSKSIVLLALALGCGLVASIGISQYMDARSAGGDSGEKQPIFVAMTDINPNDELTAQNVKVEEWPKSIVPAGALGKLEDVEGKRSRMKIYAGEPILSSKLLGDNESLGAAKEIPEGMRVVHIKVDPAQGSANLILPGDRVDVIVFKQPGADMHTMASKIILQDIKVFAVDTHTENEYTRTKSDQAEPMSAKTIALLVTPQQAVILHAATEIAGAVRLVLRNPEDKEQVASQGATIGDIFGSDQRWITGREGEGEGKDDGKGGGLAEWLNKQKAQAPPEPPPAPESTEPAAPVRRMIVLYGSELQQVEFSGNGVPSTQIVNSGGGSSGDPSTIGPSTLTGENEPQPSPPPAEGAGDETKDGNTDDSTNETKNGNTDDNKDEFISPD
jgi:pilus assembly protein CpaB